MSEISIPQQRHHEGRFRRLIALGFSGGDTSVVDEIFHQDFVEHLAGVHPANSEGVKRLIAYLHQALPDLTCTIVDLVASDETVWARLVARGTHLGTFLGVPPTGRVVTVEIVDIARFEGNKIVEHWGLSNRHATLEQLRLDQE
jgi:predicted ester cyclase